MWIRHLCPFTADTWLKPVWVTAGIEFCTECDKLPLRCGTERAEVGRTDGARGLSHERWLHRVNGHRLKML